MKKISAILVVLLAFCWTVNAYALVDREKMEKKRSEALKRAVMAVDQTGEAPAAKPFLVKFDKNRDGKIDRREVDAVRNALK